MELPISIGNFQATNYGMFKGKGSKRHQISQMRKGQNLMESPYLLRQGLSLNLGLTKFS